MQVKYLMGIAADCEIIHILGNLLEKMEHFPIILGNDMLRFRFLHFILEHLTVVGKIVF